MAKEVVVLLGAGKMGWLLLDGLRAERKLFSVI